MRQETMGWQCHRVDHMQIICISLVTYNYASTSVFTSVVVKTFFEKTRNQDQDLRIKVSKPRPRPWHQKQTLAPMFQDRDWDLGTSASICIKQSKKQTTLKQIMEYIFFQNSQH